MEEDSTNKFFAYAIVISLIISMLAIVYVAWEFGKDVTEVKAASDTNISILGGVTDASLIEE